VAKFRTEIERGLGPSIVPVLREALGDHMGDVWEEAFRAELRRRAAAGTLPIEGDVVAIGPWWDSKGENEIDARVLAGRSTTPAMAGEAKWAVTHDAAALVASMKRKAEYGLHIDPAGLQYAVCARNTLTDTGSGVLVLTAKDLFSAD